MKCYYCAKACEGLSFEQGNLVVIAHKNCAIDKVLNTGCLQKGKERSG